MRFENIPVDGSVRLEDKFNESLEPYDPSNALPFQSAVPVGAMADHCAACEKRAVERLKHSVAQAMCETVKGYASVTERS